VSIETQVAAHYTSGTLLERILAALKVARLDPDRLTPDDLAPVDEFHIGGRQATVAVAAQLELRPGQRLLDLGSGLGGAARYFAQTHACRVTGIDLTAEFVAVANELARRAGVATADYLHGSVLDLPFEPGSFERATLLHVGMNIEDKAGLFAGVRRVLAKGGIFGVYDVMRVGAGDLNFPVPWSSRPETSFLAEPETYRRLLEAAGFEVVAERNRASFALDFFKRMAAKAAESGPPPLGIHIAMGADFPTKRQNMTENIERGLIAPVEMICRVS